jgi:hypothetical protein
MRTFAIIVPMFALVLYFINAVGCCCWSDKEFDLEWDPGEFIGEPAEEPGMGAEKPGEPMAPARTFNEALSNFVRALESKNPRDFKSLAGDKVLVGEPYTEGEYLSRDEFVELLSADDSPYAQALYSDERVSSFVTEFKAGTLDTADWGVGGYSAATADYAWFVAFEPAADGNWYLNLCAVALIY